MSPAEYYSWQANIAQSRPRCCQVACDVVQRAHSPYKAIGLTYPAGPFLAGRHENSGGVHAMIILQGASSYSITPPSLIRVASAHQQVESISHCHLAAPLRLTFRALPLKGAAHHPLTARGTSDFIRAPFIYSSSSKLIRPIHSHVCRYCQVWQEGDRLPAIDSFAWTGPMRSRPSMVTDRQELMPLTPAVQTGDRRGSRQRRASHRLQFGEDFVTVGLTPSRPGTARSGA